MERVRRGEKKLGNFSILLLGRRGRRVNSFFLGCCSEGVNSTGCGKRGVGREKKEESKPKPQMKGFSLLLPPFRL